MVCIHIHIFRKIFAGNQNSEKVIAGLWQGDIANNLAGFLLSLNREKILKINLC